MEKKSWLKPYSIVCLKCYKIDRTKKRWKERKQSVTQKLKWDSKWSQFIIGSGAVELQKNRQQQQQQRNRNRICENGWDRRHTRRFKWNRIDSETAFTSPSKWDQWHQWNRESKQRSAKKSCNFSPIFTHFLFISRNTLNRTYANWLDFIYLWH